MPDDSAAQAQAGQVGHRGLAQVRGNESCTAHPQPEITLPFSVAGSMGEAVCLPREMRTSSFRMLGISFFWLLCSLLLYHARVRQRNRRQRQGHGVVGPFHSGGRGWERVGRGLGEGGRGLGEGGRGLGEGWESVGRGWERVGRGLERVGRRWERVGRGWERVGRGWERVARGWERVGRGWENVGEGWERLEEAPRDKDMVVAARRRQPCHIQACNKRPIGEPIRWAYYGCLFAGTLFGLQGAVFRSFSVSLGQNDHFGAFFVVHNLLLHRPRLSISKGSPVILAKKTSNLQCVISHLPCKTF